MLASRLGSLTTVLTWLRSRACAGMQVGVLALVVVAPSRSVQGITWNIAEFAPSLGPVPLPPTCPEPKPLHPPPDRQANPSLTPSLDLLLFGTANQAPNCHRPYAPPNPLLQPRPSKFAPSLGPVSLPLTPPEPKPLHPPPVRCNLCVTALTTVQTARQSGVSFTAEALECNFEHMDIMHWRVGHVTALAGITSFNQAQI